MALQWHQVSALVWKNRLLVKRESKSITTLKLLFAWQSCTSLATLHTKFRTADVPNDDPGLNLMFSVMSLALISLPCLILAEDLISKIMMEKTGKIREHLRIQGVSETSHALAYLLHYLLVAMAVSFCLFLIAILHQTVQFAMVVFCILLAAVAVAYAQCAFFDNATVARFFALVTWLVPMSFVLAQAYMTYGAGSASGAQFAFVETGAWVMQYLHPGALWAHNFAHYDTILDLPFRRLAIIALCQAVVYFAAGLYLHQVLPSKYGRSRPWNFLFGSGAEYALPGPVTKAVATDPTRFESVDGQRPAGICFRDVVKEFDEGAVKAVNGVTMDVYRDEVFALLGHNGAGKTTLLECLVGLETPTAGRIVVDGRDSTSGAASHQSIGYCPQFDAFYPTFQPVEVLQLYSRLRGETAAESQFKSETLLEQLGLLRKAHSPASSLSGGQMRKLSVGLAFVGKCKTVVLDEPSSGLDLESSLELWSVIRNLRQGKTVVLTTHNMTEAEALGDRIGIMSVGSMQCLGTPMFLKANLGSGYRISFRVGDDVTSRARLEALVAHRTPNATPLPSINTQELSFQIPKADAARIPDLLAQLESAPAMDEYHLTPTQLEDVFIRIAREHEDRVTSGVAPLRPLPEFTPEPASRRTHLRALLVLLAHHLRADCAYHVSLMIPILLVLVSTVSAVDHFLLGYVVLAVFTATVACSNLQHFARTDVRLQLDLFGVPWYTYAPVVLAFSLVQTVVPFALYQLCYLYSGHTVASYFASTGVVLSVVFMMVGFMALLRTWSTSIGGWKVAVFPLVVYNLVVPGTNGPALVNYAIETLQLHPWVLFLHRTLDRTPMDDFDLIAASLVLGVIYFLVAIVVDYRSLHPNSFALVATKSTPASASDVPVDDDDVEAEAKRLRSGRAADVLQVVDLTKSYGTVAAVRGVSVGVAGGQSLAFLGVNGSGKSSSIRCMLGITSVTDGAVHVAGVDVRRDEFGARQQIGYVPQHDRILIGRMTGRQQLEFVARLAGVPAHVRTELVNTMLANIGLNAASANRRIDTYSGGMKRKLCVALALLTRRKVVLLDEPSTGVDPVSRRRFWSMFADVQADPDRCLLLTTHQLDEAEAVCEKISIMVHGRIVCLGTAAQLKRKFGNHYQIDLSCRSRDDLGAVHQWLTAKYSRASLVEADGVHLRFWLRKADCGSFAELFAFVSDHGDVPVRESLVGHATLDQIFLSLAHKAKRNPEAHYIQVMPSFA